MRRMTRSVMKRCMIRKNNDKWQHDPRQINRQSMLISSMTRSMIIRRWTSSLVVPGINAPQSSQQPEYAPKIEHAEWNLVQAWKCIKFMEMRKIEDHRIRELQINNVNRELLRSLQIMEIEGVHTWPHKKTLLHTLDEINDVKSGPRAAPRVYKKYSRYHSANRGQPIVLYVKLVLFFFKKNCSF